MRLLDSGFDEQASWSLLIRWRLRSLVKEPLTDLVQTLPKLRLRKTYLGGLYCQCLTKLLRERPRAYACGTPETTLRANHCKVTCRSLAAYLTKKFASVCESRFTREFRVFWAHFYSAFFAEMLGRRLARQRIDYDAFLAHLAPLALHKVSRNQRAAV
jgi:hypothetical protein